MAERYYLMPGRSIGKLGLPAGKLVCKESDKPLEIKPKLVEVLKKNLGYFISQGTIVTGTVLDELAEKAEEAENAAKEKAAESGKSEKRIALETEAESLGIEFNTKTSGKDLEALIDAKLLETGDDE